MSPFILQEKLYLWPTWKLPRDPLVKDHCGPVLIVLRRLYFWANSYCTEAIIVLNISYNEIPSVTLKQG